VPKRTKGSVDTVDLKATDEEHREMFRAALMASIQEALAAADKPPRLASFWDNLGDASRALKRQLSLEHSNLEVARKVKKVASDAKRLQNAIGTLLHEHPSTAAVLEDCMHEAPGLYPTMREAERISRHADQMADLLTTSKPRDASKFSYALASQGVLVALIRARVRIRTRNDSNSRTNDQHDQALTGGKRRFAYLPPIDRQSSLAMKCAMLVLFDAGHEELDWGLARNLIRDGRKFRVAGARIRRHIAETRGELLNAVRALTCP